MKKKNILLLSLATLVAAGAGYFGLTRWRRAQDTKPPRKAPQLKLDNPGVQDEFPSAPDESRMVK